MTQTEKQGYIDRLQGYKLTDWQPLFDLIPLLESTEQPTGNALDDLLWGFARASTHTPNINIIFDWGSWSAGKTVLLSDQPDFAAYDLLTLCMFVTTIVRADRFNEGFLQACYRKGIILSLLKNIRTRVEEHPI